MNPVVTVPDPLAEPAVVQDETFHPEAVQTSATSSKVNPYPLIGIALALASAALTCGGLWYVLKRTGIIHLHR